jgi:hypothetical protein
LVADATVEGDDGAVFTGADVADEGSRVDGLDDETKEVVARKCHHCGSASADWREKGNFVAGVERGAPGSEFLITRGDQRRAEAGELGMSSAVMGEELLDARAVGELDRVFGAADDIFETTEEKNFDAHGLRSAWHKGIVTRAPGGGQ